jgi:arsenate reductase-like glutaredoxin family protein
MPKAIDWLYHRKSCITCARAEAFRDAAGTAVKETVLASKVKYGPAEALALLEGIDTIIAAKGTKVRTLDLKNGGPDEEAILALLIGPTGNLRAPAAKVGRTLLVGFHEDTYAEVLG